MGAVAAFCDGKPGGTKGLKTPGKSCVSQRGRGSGARFGERWVGICGVYSASKKILFVLSMGGSRTRGARRCPRTRKPAPRTFVTNITKVLLENLVQLYLQATAGRRSHKGRGEIAVGAASIVSSLVSQQSRLARRAFMRSYSTSSATPGESNCSPAWRWGLQRPARSPAAVHLAPETPLPPHPPNTPFSNLGPSSPPQAHPRKLLEGVLAASSQPPWTQAAGFVTLLLGLTALVWVLTKLIKAHTCESHIWNLTTGCLHD